jgi:hypothetical protein
MGVQGTQDSEANLREEFWNIVEFSKGTCWWEKKHFITSTVLVADSLSQDETDLGNLNFPFCFDRLEVHVPPFDGPESIVFKFYIKVTSLL